MISLSPRSPAHSAETAQRAFLQRLVQFIEQPTSDGRLIPGTRLSEERLRQFVQFLRLRAQGDQPMALRIRWILGQLENAASGEQKVAGISLNKLQRLLRSIPGHADFSIAALPSAQAAPQPDRLAEQLPAFDARLAALGDVLGELHGSAGQLNQRIAALEQAIAALRDWRATLEQPTARPETRTAPQAPREPDSDASIEGWFSDFLD